MEVNKQKTLGTNIGSLSLVMVFSILSLTVFAILSFVTANNEYKLAKKFASSVENFYAADYIAWETIEQLRLGLEPTEEISVTYEANKVSFFVPIDENRVLNIHADISGEHLNILSWQTENISSQIYDDSLPVWTGEEGVLP